MPAPPASRSGAALAVRAKPPRRPDVDVDVVVIGGGVNGLGVARDASMRGLKAFVRAPLLPIARACVVEKDVFASEFVIRAYRAGLRVREIPVRVLEKRPPSINLVKRVPNVLKSLAKLTYAIRVKG